MCTYMVISKHCKYLYVSCKPLVPTAHTDEYSNSLPVVVCVQCICILALWYVCSAKMGTYCIGNMQTLSPAAGHALQIKTLVRAFDSGREQATFYRPREKSCGLFHHTRGILAPHGCQLLVILLVQGHMSGRLLFPCTQ